MDASRKPLVLVTGSSGLIGGRVCRRLANDWSVVGLDVKEPERPIEGVQFLRCDLTQRVSVDEGLQQVRERYGDRIASVVHLAAYYDFSGEPSPLYDELTVEGTRRLLNGLKIFFGADDADGKPGAQSGRAVEQFLFSSSLLAMKPCETGELLTESSPTEAKWDYPQSKLAAERVIQTERGKIPAVILRVAGVYDEACHSLPIAQNIHRIAEKQLESYFFPGNAEHGQAFIHLDDLINCIERVIQRRLELGDYEVFLIAEEECLSYEALQDRLGELIHGKNDWPTIRIPKAVAKAGAWVQQQLAPQGEEPFIKPWMVDLADAHYPVDASRAKATLNWTPHKRLSRTLPAMVALLKRDPQTWYDMNNLPLPEEVEERRAAQAGMKE